MKKLTCPIFVFIIKYAYSYISKRVFFDAVVPITLLLILLEIMSINGSKRVYFVRPRLHLSVKTFARGCGKGLREESYEVV